MLSATVDMMSPVAREDVALVARAIHSGADDVLMKPFDRALVAEKLAQVGLA